MTIAIVKKELTKATIDKLNFKLRTSYFVTYSLSNGEQYITTAQLERRIRQICSVTLKREAAEDSDTLEDDSPGEF